MYFVVNNLTIFWLSILLTHFMPLISKTKTGEVGADKWEEWR